MEKERERVRGTTTLLNFQISNYAREFHKILINRERERIVQPLKVCLFKGCHFLEEILSLSKGCLKDQLLKMRGYPVESFNQ